MAITKILITMSVLLFGLVFGNYDGGFDGGFDNADMDRGYFENGFDDNGMFLDSPDDSFMAQGGISGGSIVRGGIAGSAGGMGPLDYNHHHQRHQPRFDDRARGGLLGDRFAPIRQRPMVMPRRRMPMVLPPIGGGVGGLPRFKHMGGATGGILGARRMRYQRRRVSPSIGGFQRSRGFRRMGRGGIAGMSRRRFRTY